jgi:hypothetical protein
VDPSPPGDNTPGDGLVFFEEYRGTVVRGEHRRTDPSVKDLFIYSGLSQGIADAVTLPVTKHRIFLNEMGITFAINPNYTNGNTVQGNIPGHYSQLAHKVIDAGYGSVGVYGYAYVVGPPSGRTNAIEIYVEGIREASPPTPSRTADEPFDDEAIRFTIGHEIGHGISIPHNTSWTSIMVTEYLPLTTNVNDQAWNNIPHVYDQLDRSYIRLR